MVRVQTFDTGIPDKPEIYLERKLVTDEETEAAPTRKAQIEKQLVEDRLALDLSRKSLTEGNKRMIIDVIGRIYNVLGVEETRKIFEDLFKPNLAEKELLNQEGEGDAEFLLNSRIAQDLSDQLEAGHAYLQLTIRSDESGRERVVKFPRSVLLTKGNPKFSQPEGNPYSIYTIEGLLSGFRYAFWPETSSDHSIARLSQAGKVAHMVQAQLDERYEWNNERGYFRWTTENLGVVASCFGPGKLENINYRQIFERIAHEEPFQEYLSDVNYQPDQPLPYKAAYLIRRAVDWLRRLQKEQFYENLHVPPPTKDIPWHKLLLDKDTGRIKLKDDFMNVLVNGYRQWRLENDDDFDEELTEVNATEKVMDLVRNVVLTGHLPARIHEPLISALGVCYEIDPTLKSIRDQLSHFKIEEKIPPLMKALAGLVKIEEENIHADKKAQIEHDWGQLIFADQLSPQIYTNLRRYIEGEPNRKLPRNLHDTLVEICNDKGITPPSISAVRRYLLTQRQGYLAQQKRILTEEV